MHIAPSTPFFGLHNISLPFLSVSLSLDLFRRLDSPSHSHRYLNKMEQVDSTEGTDNPPEVSSNHQSLEKNDSKKAIDPTEVYLNDLELVEDSKKGTESPPELSSNPRSTENDDSKKDTDPPEGYVNNIELEDSKGTENPPEVPTNPQSTERADSKKDTDPPEGYLNNMELEDSNKDTENPPEVTKSSEKNDSKKDTDPPGRYLNDMELEKGKKGAENPPEVSYNPQSSEKDDSKDSDPPGESSKPELSDKHTTQSLKAKSKIVKKSLSDKFKTIKNEASRQIRAKRKNWRKKKKVVSNAANEKQISDSSQQMKTSDEPPLQEAEKNKEKECQNRSTSKKGPIKESHQAQKNKKIAVFDRSEEKRKNNGKHKESNKSLRIRINEDNGTGMEKSQSKEKKRDKLGGIIFMCNAKTKPDCFHYRVMGVTAGKKDAILSVKSGLKLFLYDFDLKLLYGIYKATSSGGMKLEPRAFGGKYPAQVRFKIASDCYPLPESIFKKAIKENYNQKHKFKNKLTVRQVKRLTELFRPVEVHSALAPVRSPRRSIIRDRVAPDSVRGSWSHLHRERAAGDPYINVNSYDVWYPERDHRIERREEINRENYRPYGLQGDRRKVTTAYHVNPILEPYERDYEHLHNLDPSYRSNVREHVEFGLRTGPLRSNESEYQNYFHSAFSDHTKDPYHAYRYGASPRDAYLPPLCREVASPRDAYLPPLRREVTSPRDAYLPPLRREVASPRDAYLPPLSRGETSSNSYLVGERTLIGSGNLHRREAVDDRLYSKYSEPYHGDRWEASLAPVSSRYSFAGPSFSRR